MFSESVCCNPDVELASNIIGDASSKWKELCETDPEYADTIARVLDRPEVGALPIMIKNIEAPVTVADRAKLLLTAREFSKIFAPLISTETEKHVVPIVGQTPYGDKQIEEHVELFPPSTTTGACIDYVGIERVDGEPINWDHIKMLSFSHNKVVVEVRHSEDMRAQQLLTSQKDGVSSSSGGVMSYLWTYVVSESKNESPLARFDLGSSLFCAKGSPFVHSGGDWKFSIAMAPEAANSEYRLVVEYRKFATDSGDGGAITCNGVAFPSQKAAVDAMKYVSLNHLLQRIQMTNQTTFSTCCGSPAVFRVIIRKCGPIKFLTVGCTSPVTSISIKSVGEQVVMKATSAEELEPFKRTYGEGAAETTIYEIPMSNKTSGDDSDGAQSVYALDAAVDNDTQCINTYLQLEVTYTKVDEASRESVRITGYTANGYYANKYIIHT